MSGIIIDELIKKYDNHIEKIEKENKKLKKELEKNKSFLIKKNIKTDLRSKDAWVKTDLIDPFIYLYIELFYKEYLELIHYICRNHMFVSDIIFYFEKMKKSKKKSTILKELKEMEQLKLIKITKDKYNYITLTKTSLIYLKENKNAKEPPVPSELLLQKSKYLFYIYRNTSLKVLIKKTQKRYSSFLNGLVKTKLITEDFKDKELKRYNNTTTSTKDLITIDELEQKHIYIKALQHSYNAYTMHFYILDLQNLDKFKLAKKLSHILVFCRRFNIKNANVIILTNKEKKATKLKTAILQIQDIDFKKNEWNELCDTLRDIRISDLTDIEIDIKTFNFVEFR